MSDEDFRKFFEEAAEFCYKAPPEISKSLLDRILTALKQKGSGQKNEGTLK